MTISAFFNVNILVSVTMRVVNDITSETNLLRYPSVKDEQRKVVTNVVYGKDVFAVLPTGYGKAFVCLFYQACLIL